MCANVYYCKIDANTDLLAIQKITKQLLGILVEKENVALEQHIPLKVHFGEAKNETFIRPENYIGVIDFLKKRNIESSYIETSVMYGGQRF